MNNGDIAYVEAESLEELSKKVNRKISTSGTSGDENSWRGEFKPHGTVVIHGKKYIQALVYKIRYG